MATATQHGSFVEGSLAALPLPATLRTPVPLTDEELLEFSRHNSLYRVERNANGELEIMSPVGGDDSRWEAAVIYELYAWARDNSGIAFSSNGGFSLPDGSMLSPDASWVSDARWNALSTRERRSFPTLCPDFVVEILSATDSRLVLEAKMERWLANGTKLAWMIDPYAATLSPYKPNAAVEVLDHPDSIGADEPVPGFRLTTHLLWDR